jgi:hypothetical protein
LVQYFGADIGEFCVGFGLVSYCREVFESGEVGEHRWVDDAVSDVFDVEVVGWWCGEGVVALWSWLRYVVGWRKHRERHAHPLSTTASVAILALCLGYYLHSKELTGLIPA